MTTFAIFAVLFALVMARSPLVRRMVGRNIARRPREAALVVLGSLLGTALVTGSLVVGDTLRASIRHIAYAQLGPVDEAVVLPDEASWTEATRRLARPPAGVDGVLPLALLRAPAATPGSAPRGTAPRAQLVEADFSRARAMGTGAGQSSGLEGSTPRTGHAAVSASLARKLGVRTGNRLVTYPYGTALSLTVDRVLPDRGLASYVGQLGGLPDDVFVAPGTIPRSPAGAVTDTAGPRWQIGVSNDGGVIEGDRGTTPVTREVTARLRGLGAQVVPAKHVLLVVADSQGKRAVQLFTTMGVFGIIAGMLLLVNVFAMLAQERTAELAMMRAVGLRRRTLVAAFTSEGYVYAAVAAVLGALAGLGLGRAIVVLVAGLLRTSDQALFVAIHFHVSRATVETGVAAGLLLGVGTVLLTSIRMSRFDVVAAIHDQRQSARVPSHAFPLVAGAIAAMVGSVWTAVGIGTTNTFGVLLGPVLLAAGFGALSAPLLGPRKAITTASILAVLWTAVGVNFISYRDVHLDITDVVVHGLVLVSAGILVVSYQQHRLAALVRRVARRSHALPARVGTMYPLGRPVRTGLTLAPFAIVVFTLSWVTMLSAMINGQIDKLAVRAAGGYHAVVQSSDSRPLPAQRLKEIPGVRAVGPLARVTADYVLGSSAERRTWFLSAVDERFLAAKPPALVRRGNYRTDREAYEAVIRNPDLVIVDALFLRTSFFQPGGSPLAAVKVGDTVTIVDPVSGQARVVTVAAISPGDFALDGALYGRRGASELFGDRLIDNRGYVSLASPKAVHSFVSQAGTRLFSDGVEAFAFSSLTREATASTRQFLAIVKAFLGLGVVGGVAGLGVVMWRSVRERRRQIGMLRAIGFSAPLVGRSVLYESVFVAMEGVLLGVVLAAAVIWSALRSDLLLPLTGTRPGFPLPAGQIGLLAAGTLLIAIVAALGPARSAARVPPSEALRFLD